MKLSQYALRHQRILILAFISFFCSSSNLMASVIYDDVEFPQGDISFADSVFDYSPVGNNFGYPTAPHRRPEAALGAPQDPRGVCTDAASCDYVSLGFGGSITLQFIDNFLTGSNNSDFDLWIFEIGNDVEDTFVEISINGIDWFDVGKVFGSTGGIDIDAFGFTSNDFFSFVRLTDDPNEGEGFFGGITTGADIDSVGAISTVVNPDPSDPNDVSAPPALALSFFAFLILCGLRKGNQQIFHRA